MEDTDTTEQLSESVKLFVFKLE